MKITRVAVLGVAVGAGVIAAVLAFNLTRQPSAPAPEVPVVVNLNQVLVAARDIPMGTTLDEGSVEWKEWPKTSISDKFIKVKGADGNALPAVSLTELKNVLEDAASLARGDAQPLRLRLHLLTVLRH